MRGIASITLTNAPTTVDFRGTPTYGIIPLTVQFEEISAPSTADWWMWEFGDGTESYEQNPAHTYLKAGMYTVTLTAGNAAGNATETKIDYIIAVLPPNPGSGGSAGGDDGHYTETTPEVTQVAPGEPAISQGHQEGKSSRRAMLQGRRGARYGRRQASRIAARRHEARGLHRLSLASAPRSRLRSGAVAGATPEERNP